MTDWRWRPERTTGIWRHGAGWMRPFVAAAPFLSVLLLLMLFRFVSGTLTLSQGVLFDLPEHDGFGEGESTELVLLVLPMRHETMAFFDDSRYLLDDAAPVRSLGERVAERVSESGSTTLLVLADRRVAGGELMKVATLVRKSGVRRLLFAKKNEEASE